MQPLLRAVTFTLATSIALLITACSPAPDRTAGIWLWPGESLTLQATGPIEGPPPKVRISNQGPGPLSAIAWVRPDGVTDFAGIPVGGDMVLNINNADTLRIADGGGSRLQIDMWSTTDYRIENAPPTGPLKGLSSDQVRAKLSSR